MDLKTLYDTPPWEWPRNAGKRFQETLLNPGAKESDRLIAAELAGSLVVMNAELAGSLLAIIRGSGEPEGLRAKAAIALGPVLEQAYTDEFDDPEDVPITQPMFLKIQKSLQILYLDNTIPKEVRRRILEASVRAPENWHREAIGAAYSSGDKELVLTAVFSMRWVRGFDDQILEALKSADPLIHYEAVKSAGTWGPDKAWSHVVDLVNDSSTPKHLLIAAIVAVGCIRPSEAREILTEFAGSDDEDIAEAADETILIAEGTLEYEEEDDEDEEDDKEPGTAWVN